MSASEMPVLLGRICSSWRAISISTPRLWASLHIVRPSRPPSHSSELQSFEKKCSQRLETLKAWLCRSGNCPLSISLEDGVDRGPDASISPRSESYLPALIPFALRWQEIKFSCQGPMMRDEISNLAPSDVPILQEITIHDRGAHMDWWSSASWASVGLLGAFGLSKFSLSAGNPGFTELPVRWNQLTSLSLLHADGAPSNTLTTDRVLEILSQCSVLRKCRLTVYDHPGVGSQGAGPVVECCLLAELHLSCQNDPAWTLPRLFHRLSLPGLRKFVLRGLVVQQSPSTLSFSSFLAAVTRLEILDIPSDKFSKASLTELLQGLPTIQQLQITSTAAGGDFSGDDILELLTPSEDLPFLCCPALQELVLRGILPSDATLLRLINARMAEDRPSPLKRVEATFLRERQFDILPALRQFQDTGFHIFLRYFTPVPSEFSPWLGVDESSDSEDAPPWHSWADQPRSTTHYGF
ncbi:hypothetical protein DFH06DRAFT_1230570 [Mycena polygramma]|nr:hypothetical protein DFH06DRAFT_1230570 [Mycena polygramma]